MFDDMLVVVMVMALVLHRMMMCIYVVTDVVGVCIVVRYDAVSFITAHVIAYISVRDMWCDDVVIIVVINVVVVIGVSVIHADLNDGAIIGVVACVSVVDVAVVVRVIVVVIVCIVCGVWCCFLY